LPLFSTRNLVCVYRSAISPAEQRIILSTNSRHHFIELLIHTAYNLPCRWIIHSSFAKKFHITDFTDESSPMSCSCIEYLKFITRAREETNYFIRERKTEIHSLSSSLIFIFSLFSRAGKYIWNMDKALWSLIRQLNREFWFLSISVKVDRNELITWG